MIVQDVAFHYKVIQARNTRNKRWQQSVDNTYIMYANVKHDHGN